MKIVDLKTYVVGNPPPHRGGRNWVFLKVVELKEELAAEHPYIAVEPGIWMWETSTDLQSKRIIKKQ